MLKGISRDKFRILFDHSSDAHFIVDETGITDCNEAMVRLLNCKDRKEVLSIHPSLLSPEFQPDGSRSLEKSKEMDALARKNGLHRFEWTHKRSTGEEFPVQVTLNAVEIDEKPALIAVWHDLTEIKNVENALRTLNDRMRSELESASEFQRSLLPATSLRSDIFESAWFYKPCDELGGDSLNIFQIDDSYVGFYVLDVTGHGVASALLSVTATHFLSGFFKAHCPQNVVENMNKHFARKSFKNHTFTLLYGVLDLKNRAFTYTSAGHLGPILIRKNGETCQFESHGMPVGIFEDATYSRQTIQMSAGDRLFLISDGVYEARNADKEELGAEGVYAHLKKENLNNYPLDYTVNSLARTTYHWCRPNKPDDDISIIGLEIK